jgi:DNA modification methylase
VALITDKTRAFDLDLKIDYRDTTSLKLDPQNTRHHTADQIAKLAATMTEFGMVVPILRDRDDNVVAGHGRVMAARKAGIAKIPTILIDHLSPAQLRAFAIADNKLHDLSDWDEVMLAEELKTLSAMDLDFSLEATGFEVAEIDTLILGPQGPMGEGDDEVLPPIGPAVSRPGDLWQLGPHRILCGNALEAASYERLLEGKPADMAFSDAPYGVPIAGHASTRRGAKQHREFLMGGGGMSAAELRVFFAKSFQQLRASTKPGAVIYASIDWRHAAAMQAAAEEAGLELINIAVWVKSNPGMGSFYRSAHEFVLVLRHPGAGHRNNVELGRHGRSRSNVWRYDSANDFGRGGGEGDLLAKHPTPKPVPLVAGAILDATARGEVVLDNFLGSGSTIIAAERTGRIGYGIELDPGYVDVAVRRWQQLTGKDAIEAASGKVFNDREEEREDGDR